LRRTSAERERAGEAFFILYGHTVGAMDENGERIENANISVSMGPHISVERPWSRRADIQFMREGVSFIERAPFFDQGQFLPDRG